MMRDYDFMLTEEQRELRDLVEEFAQNEVKPICREAVPAMADAGGGHMVACHLFDE